MASLRVFDSTGKLTSATVEVDDAVFQAEADAAVLF